MSKTVNYEVVETSTGKFRVRGVDTNGNTVTWVGGRKSRIYCFTRKADAERIAKIHSDIDAILNKLR